jgi:hypothetical protein
MRSRLPPTFCPSVLPVKILEGSRHELVARQQPEACAQAQPGGDKVVSANGLRMGSHLEAQARRAGSWRREQWSAVFALPNCQLPTANCQLPGLKDGLAITGDGDEGFGGGGGGDGGGAGEVATDVKRGLAVDERFALGER